MVRGLHHLKMSVVAEPIIGENKEPKPAAMFYGSVGFVLREQLALAS